MATLEEVAEEVLDECALRQVGVTSKEELGELTWETVRERLNTLMLKRGVFGGAPMPIRHASLVVEPRYPYQGLNGFTLDDEEDEDVRVTTETIWAGAEKVADRVVMPDGRELTRDELCEEIMKILSAPDKTTTRNCWWSRRLQAYISIYERDGTIFHDVDSAWVYRYRMLFHSMGCYLAYSPKAELVAQEKLKTLVTEAQWESYMCSGMFLETSERSDIVYMFRRQRPTIAIGHDKNSLGDIVRIPLCGLCLHPVGYYQATFAGCMVPTDDIISHLLMMRGAEHKYWAHANQHPIDHPQAGI